VLPSGRSISRTASSISATSSPAVSALIVGVAPDSLPGFEFYRPAPAGIGSRRPVCVALRVTQPWLERQPAGRRRSAKHHGRPRTGEASDLSGPNTLRDASVRASNTAPAAW
jgi:hypothetical protein